MVNVTDVRVRRINQEGRMKSIVSVTIDDAFVIHDVKVVEGQNGLFVAMPSRKMPDGDYRDIAHPINSEARGIIQKFVLEAYDRAWLSWKKSSQKNLHPMIPTKKQIRKKALNRNFRLIITKLNESL